MNESPDFSLTNNTQRPIYSLQRPYKTHLKVAMGHCASCSP